MSNIQEEIVHLKGEVERLTKENEALNIIKKKWDKHVDYQIKTMTMDMSEGKAKDDFIKMMMKQFF
jgi:hypothetical protein